MYCSVRRLPTLPESPPLELLPQSSLPKEREAEHKGRDKTAAAAEAEAAESNKELVLLPKPLFFRRHCLALSAKGPHFAQTECKSPSALLITAPKGLPSSQEEDEEDCACC